VSRSKKKKYRNGHISVNVSAQKENMQWRQKYTDNAKYEYIPKPYSNAGLGQNVAGY
jgi:hypothetical protein